MREQKAQCWKTVEHAGADQRADAERGVHVYWAICDSPNFALRGARLRLHRMDEHRDVERDRGLPEGVEVEFAEIDAFDIGRHDGARPRRAPSPREVSSAAASCAS